ncbi:hypothetical protein PMAYCL1PPCAC_26086, partial [Pristionchus mayeri]
EQYCHKRFYLRCKFLPFSITTTVKSSSSMDVCVASDELKQKYFDRIPEAVIYDGIILPGTDVTEECIRLLNEKVFGQDNIVIASCTKSGTTWLAQVLSEICYNDAILKSVPMEKSVPWMEWKVNVLLPDHPLLLMDTVSSPKKRIWHTQIPLRHLPQSIREGKCKLLYVARNPKDQAVSNFHYHKMARHLGLQTDLSWDDFFRLHCSGSLRGGSWFDHVLEYWEFSRTNPNVKFLFFEDLKVDLAKEVKKIEEFIGVPLTSEERDNVIEHCSFQAMKANTMANRSGHSSLDHTRGEFLRKGVVGDWKNHFTVAQSEAFD